VSPEEAQARFAAARVARLATADADGVPHLVPVVFAAETGAGGDVIYSAVDAKPKRTTALRRLANVRANPRVTLLVDVYDDAHWDALWWVRADGDGYVIEPGEPEARHAVGLLVARYRQYRDAPPAGPVLAVRVRRWSGWTAGPGV
jgi:PPOX class probable F420-dependent enzyme